MIGVVKWFDDAKVMVSSSEEGRDIFVHHTAIQNTGFRSLSEGQRVRFDVSQGPKEQAQNVGSFNRKRRSSMTCYMLNHAWNKSLRALF